MKKKIIAVAILVFALVVTGCSKKEVEETTTTKKVYDINELVKDGRIGLKDGYTDLTFDRESGTITFAINDGVVSYKFKKKSQVKLDITNASLMYVAENNPDSVYILTTDNEVYVVDLNAEKITATLYLNNVSNIYESSSKKLYFQVNSKLIYESETSKTYEDIEG